MDTLIEKTKDWKFWFEWICTILLLTGVILTSFNIYPLNIWFLLIGNIGWVVLGILWHKISLIVMQTVITVIYVAGLLNIVL